MSTLSATPTAQAQQPAPQQDPAEQAEQHSEEDIDLSCESVAGEEDPGASLDLSAAPDPACPTPTQNVPA